MDLTVVASGLFKNAWFLIPLAIVAFLAKSAWFKGVVGEAIVSLLAVFYLNKDDYHLVSNVTLPTEDGTTQIDHIIVSKYGVFVVETKNMKGWIFGRADQPYWTQKIFKVSHKFQNPLRQNYKHTKTLHRCLNIEEDKIFSVIVFVGNSTFKNELPHNVTRAGGYIRFIKSKTNEVLNDVQVKEILSQIQEGRLKPSLKTNIGHRKHVKELVTKKEKDILCQQCGSKMIKREAAKGANKGKQFLGCSAFPKCRSIQQVT